MAKIDPYITQEKEWQKECDARTLADAEEIKANNVRLRGAQSAAKKMVKEAEIKTKAMNKIAKATVETTIKIKKATPKKATPKKATSRTKAKSSMKTNSNTKTPYKRK